MKKIEKMQGKNLKKNFKERGREKRGRGGRGRRGRKMGKIR